MPASSSESTPVGTFIFQGTVRKVKSSTLKDIPVDDQTVIVTVDNVIEAPKSLAKLTGSEITVQLTGNQKASLGETEIFHSSGWIFGDSVAVQCISKEPVKATHAALLTRGGNPIEHRRNRVVENRFADADTIVSGPAAAVPPPAAPPPRRRAPRAATEPVETGPVSEHNPRWRDAVIAIDKTQKGRTDKDRLVIRFPSSTDVRWYKAPKFTPGQQGFSCCRKPKSRKRCLRRLPARPEKRRVGQSHLRPRRSPRQQRSIPRCIRKISSPTANPEESSESSISAAKNLKRSECPAINAASIKRRKNGSEKRH